MLEYTSKNYKIHFIIFSDDTMNNDIKFVINFTMLPLGERKTKKIKYSHVSHNVLVSDGLHIR